MNRLLQEGIAGPESQNGFVAFVQVVSKNSR
jgi:hypothetical protein